MLANISGTRKVWVADRDAVSPRVARDERGGTIFLDLDCDPSINELAVCAANGVKWTGPVVLQAGDAIYIPRGFWHCLLSEAGAVAVPIEIVSVESGDPQPHVIRHAGARTDRARAQRWGSAASVLELWAPALEVFEFQTRPTPRRSSSGSRASARGGSAQGFMPRASPVRRAAPTARCGPA